MVTRILSAGQWGILRTKTIAIHIQMLGKNTAVLAWSNKHAHTHACTHWASGLTNCFCKWPIVNVTGTPSTHNKPVSLTCIVYSTGAGGAFLLGRSSTYLLFVILVEQGDNRTRNPYSVPRAWGPFLVFTSFTYNFTHLNDFVSVLSSQILFLRLV